MEDKRGNDGADKLAVAGANMHRVSLQVVGAAQQRKKIAMNVQRMMVAVLQARASAQHSIHQEAEDEHLSELGDCMKLECMELDCIDSSIDDDTDNGDTILSDAR